MSRSGYSDSDDYGDLWATIRWRGAVKSALRGKSGQKFLRELIAALDALPVPALAAGSLQTADGEFCALGAVGRARKLDMAWAAEREEDGDDLSEDVACEFSIARAMAAEIMHLNDEGGAYDETPRRRWERMRTWALRHLASDL